MIPVDSRLERIAQTSMLRIRDLESRLASVEQLLNQQSMLLDTLTNVMVEKRRPGH